MPRSRRTIEAALNGLQAASTETENVLNRLARQSQEISAHNSSAVLGIFGGLFGMGSAYLISLLAVSTSLFILAPVLSGVGLVGGVLAARGSRRFRIERTLNNNRLAADEILNRIKELPKDAPPDVIEDLWTIYRSLTANLHEKIVYDIKEKHVQDDSPSLRLVPSQNVPSLKLLPISSDIVVPAIVNSTNSSELPNRKQQ